MAQHIPISNIATTGGITSTALGVFLHVSWELLFAMASISAVLIIGGMVRLLRGERVLAREKAIRNQIHLT